MRHRGEVKETITEIHQYIYAGGKLLRETISDGTTTKTLDFTYDNVGMPYSLIYNNGTTTTTYYYITNLQGDVMYLVDFEHSLCAYSHSRCRRCGHHTCRRMDGMPAAVSTLRLPSGSYRLAVHSRPYLPSL